ncbi:MAG: bifunctional demethylmenaquinone methyltransferase/2-methoxy-6-polyprenyl-1,4-benzoquinol methylase UbiE [Melioribacteraceae bacterium]|nr:bifunctional demethylmenaquinone methyltransferase/2-methoxy-6-polyprenyl-1,4-benzoquinol methylase UbiE [Melioribacteraceae bacterium]MCF8265391.1 bifunctional demethylmenaquinone methyltransferase/2-methoxy-6-polyprenyl-1,4-benzoquinol methylase UbiE [Melioribacteraceae bacterium]
MDKRTQVKRIFDTISPKYDFLNHFLSAGVDFYWRKKALTLTKFEPNSVLLDVACGTGDFAIEAKKHNVQIIYGADLSANMLQIFSDKMAAIKGRTVQSVAEAMPFKDSSFSNITVAFGVRNFYDILEGFKSFYRLLRESGKVTILEFRLPKSKLVRGFYMFYFNRVLPAIGRLISKDNEAYTYLPESVSEFDKNIDLKELLHEAGFTNIEYHSLTFGLVQVVIAQK